MTPPTGPGRAAPLAIVHTESSTGWGGQEIRILAESRGFLDRGHRVTLLAPPDAPIVEQARRGGIPVEPLPIARKRPGGVFALASALKRHAPDLVNTHSSTDSWLVAIACRLMRAPPPIVRTRHVSVPVPDNTASRWLYRQATARVITTGESLREALVRDLGLDPARVESIPTGIDAGRYGKIGRAEARRALALPAEAPLVGIVATLRSWKGHRHLVDALPLLARRDAMLVIVGDGPQRAALERQVAAGALDARVRFAGQQDDVAPWLAALDAFALPSTAHEGVPQALLQAMHARVPCVTTAAGAIPEIARDGDTALVVAMGDPAALARALDRLLDDRALAAALAARALAHVVPRYGYATMIDRMEAAFRATLRNAGR